MRPAARRASSPSRSVHWWTKPRSTAAARKSERGVAMARSSNIGAAAGPEQGRCRRALGLMSGTSLDGIDVAFVETDGEIAVAAGPAMTLPYPSAFRERLRGVLGGTGPVAAVEAELTRLHAEAVARFLDRNPGLTVDLVGFHGHTILHR